MSTKPDEMRRKNVHKTEMKQLRRTVDDRRLILLPRDLRRSDQRRSRAESDRRVQIIRCVGLKVGHPPSMGVAELVDFAGSVAVRAKVENTIGSGNEGVEAGQREGDGAIEAEEGRTADRTELLIVVC